MHCTFEPGIGKARAEGRRRKQSCRTFSCGNTPSSFYFSVLLAAPCRSFVRRTSSGPVRSRDFGVMGYGVLGKALVAGYVRNGHQPLVYDPNVSPFDVIDPTLRHKQGWRTAPKRPITLSAVRRALWGSRGSAWRKTLGQRPTEWKSRLLENYFSRSFGSMRMCDAGVSRVERSTAAMSQSSPCTPLSRSPRDVEAS